MPLRGGFSSPATWTARPQDIELQDLVGLPWVRTAPAAIAIDRQTQAAAPDPDLIESAGPGPAPRRPPPTPLPPDTLKFPELCRPGRSFLPSAVPQYPEIAYRAHFSPIGRKRRPFLPCAGLSRGPATWSTWKLSGSEAIHDVGEEGAILLLWRLGGWLRRLRRGRWALRQVAMDLARVKRPTWLDLLAVFRDHLSAAPFTVHTARHRVAGRVQHEPGCCEVAQIIAAYFRGENHQRLFLAHGSMVPAV